MAIALPLIVELFRWLDRAVQWLSGGNTLPDHPGRDGSGSQQECRNSEGQNSEAHNYGAPHRLYLPRKSPVAADRQWQGPVGPLRLHPARRGWRSAAQIAR